MSDIKKQLTEGEFSVGNADDSNVSNDIYNIETGEEKKVYPCIPLRGVTVFPNTIIHFDIGREKSIRALENAMANDKLLFVSTQKDDSVFIATGKDMYKLGTLVKVKQMLKIQGDAYRVLVEGLTRAYIDKIVTEETFISCTIDEVEEMKLLPEELSVEDRATLRILNNSFLEYSNISDSVSADSVEKALNAKSPIAQVDKIASCMAVSCHRKQKVLEELDFSKRMALLNGIIAEEIEIAQIERNISQKVKDNMDQNQKEYFLREKMKAIQSELGVDEDGVAESQQWLEELDKLKLDKKIDEKIRKEINRFTKMGPTSAESSVIRSYVETLLALPWNTSSTSSVNLKKAEKILNEDHYGMNKVKERILEYLAVVHLSKAIKGPIICLVGPPGVGKTSIARSIARSLGREFVRMSLGGVRDEAEIRGHRRTYIGAIPGRVISSIKEAGTNNPVFLFDEVDKIGADFKGDPASALLEVLDPEQNKTFTDHFLEVPFDLSKVMFITTANSTDTIPRPLLDRMEVIEVAGYTEEEKVKIATQYLIPKQVKEHGLKKDTLKITEKALRDLINYYTRESGVRNLQREIANLCRKVAKKFATSKHKGYSITPGNLEKYLGKHRYHYDVVEGEPQVGVTTGLAWTIVGGDTLQIETLLLNGTGKLALTGQLGDVMQESAKAGLSYARSISDEYNISAELFKEKDIHIHIPEGAVPKDGPSAGVTMFTAVMSTLTNTPVVRNLAMTGEITLRGKVLPVGGIREKVLAAHRAGVKIVLLPKENAPDLDEIPNSVKRQMEFHFIENAKEALEYAFVK